MESYTHAIKELFRQLGDYIEVNIDLLKLKAADKISRVITSIMTFFVGLLVFSLAFFVFNIGVAFWIGEILGKIYYGFFVVAGFYTILGLIFYLLRHKLFRVPLSNKIIKNLFD